MEKVLVLQRGTSQELLAQAQSAPLACSQTPLEKAVHHVRQAGDSLKVLRRSRKAACLCVPLRLPLLPAAFLLLEAFGPAPSGSGRTVRWTENCIWIQGLSALSTFSYLQLYVVSHFQESLYSFVDGRLLLGVCGWRSWGPSLCPECLEIPFAIHSEPFGGKSLLASEGASL